MLSPRAQVSLPERIEVERVARQFDLMAGKSVHMTTPRIKSKRRLFAYRQLQTRVIEPWLLPRWMSEDSD